MKQIIQKLLSLLLITVLLAPLSLVHVSAEEEPVYTTLRNIDLGTFNEFRYRLTEQFFILRE
jgi:hypothetical protein